LSARLQERVDKIQQILEKLIADSAKGSLIVVEGRKDLQALEELNIAGKIITAKTSKKSFLDVTAEIEKQPCPQPILLLDFDRRGKELTKRLTHHLETVKIKTNVKYWKELKALVGRDVKDIEGLPTYLETLNRKLLRESP
jgi:5S rRNA maturation endonuclease (ribonuclease M5)